MVQIETGRQTLVRAEVVVVDGVAIHDAKGKCHDFARLPPDEKARTLGHPLAETQKVFFAEHLEMHVATAGDPFVKRVQRGGLFLRDGVFDFQGDRRIARGAFDLLEFAAQTFAGRFAQTCLDVFLEAGETQLQPHGGQARQARVAAALPPGPPDPDGMPPGNP